MDSPTAGKQSTGLFSNPPFESHRRIKNPDTRMGIWIFWCERWDSNPHGETTRTSNVLVYHSNTLALHPSIIAVITHFVNTKLRHFLGSFENYFIHWLMLSLNQLATLSIPSPVLADMKMISILGLRIRANSTNLSQSKSK